ncbi:hypothetical protein [Domibacillus robiginosus]|uniref:hypothetical protein n=1 Tax=Domibacillus robiginosus TaxID=1071054 RepID=UPI00067BFB59|nr:hypothetical protein [Domibacillus robiginosus]
MKKAAQNVTGNGTSLLKKVVYYRVFDTVYLDEQHALEKIETWDHKESIYSIFVVMPSVEMPPKEISMYESANYSFHYHEEAADSEIEAEEANEPR